MNDTVRRWAGRLVAIGDAGISSLGNLATNILAARALDPTDYGLFAMTLLIALMIVGLSRALFGDPLTLGFSASGESARKQAAADATGAALVGVTLLAPVVAGITVLVLVGSRGGGTAALHLSLALALTAPLLVLQELVRAIAYAGANPAAAAVNSTTWTLLLVPALLLLRPDDPAVFVGIWGLTAGAGAALGLAVTGTRPRLRSPMPWLRLSRPVSRTLLPDVALTQVSAEGSFLVISLVAGAVEAGLVRKAQIPLTPVIVVTNAMITMAQPGLVRRAAEGAPLTAFAYRIGALAAGGALGLGLLVVLLPDAVGTTLVGPRWHDARPLVPVLACYLALGAIGGAQGIALRALGRIRDQLTARIVLTPLSLIVIAVAARGGAFWASVGLCGALVCVVVAWTCLLHPAARVLPPPDPDVP